MPSRLHDFCTVDGCGRKHKSRGYCQTHYMQFRRDGRVTTPVINTRVRVKPDHCIVEGCDKPVKGKGLCGMHWARKLRHGHTRYAERTKPPKICTWPACENWLYASGFCHRHYIKVRTYKKGHGLEAAQTLALLTSHGPTCDICDGLQTTRNRASSDVHDLYLDHHHGTGKLRGLLCNNCNRALGMFKDSAELLRKAAAYLDKHSE